MAKYQITCILDSGKKIRPFWVDNPTLAINLQSSLQHMLAMNLLAQNVKNVTIETEQTI